MRVWGRRGRQQQACMRCGVGTRIPFVFSCAGGRREGWLEGRLQSHSVCEGKGKGKGKESGRTSYLVRAQRPHALVVQVAHLLLLRRGQRGRVARYVHHRGLGLLLLRCRRCCGLGGRYGCWGCHCGGFCAEIGGLLRRGYMRNADGFGVCSFERLLDGGVAGGAAEYVAAAGESC